MHEDYQQSDQPDVPFQEFSIVSVSLNFEWVWGNHSRCSSSQQFENSSVP